MPQPHQSANTLPPGALIANQLNSIPFNPAGGVIYDYNTMQQQQQQVQHQPQQHPLMGTAGSHSVTHMNQQQAGAQVNQLPAHMYHQPMHANPQIIHPHYQTAGGGIGQQQQTTSILINNSNGQAIMPPFYIMNQPPPSIHSVLNPAGNVPQQPSQAPPQLHANKIKKAVVSINDTQQAAGQRNGFNTTTPNSSSSASNITAGSYHQSYGVPPPPQQQQPTAPPAGQYIYSNAANASQQFAYQQQFQQPGGGANIRMIVPGNQQYLNYPPGNLEHQQQAPQSGPPPPPSYFYPYNQVIHNPQFSNQSQQQQGGQPMQQPPPSSTPSNVMQHGGNNQNQSAPHTPSPMPNQTSQPGGGVFMPAPTHAGANPGPPPQGLIYQPQMAPYNYVHATAAAAYPNYLPQSPAGAPQHQQQHQAMQAPQGYHAYPIPPSNYGKFILKLEGSTRCCSSDWIGRL